ncbi:hypothetical protein M432DRAFT_551253 [Thermoascus aurantiacus ATCC 26904]
MAVTENYITAGRLIETGYTMIAITTFFCLARFVLRFWKSAGFQVEDAFVLLSWIFFLVLAIDYIVVTPVMYRVTEIEAGRAPPYPTLEKDALFMIKIFFTNTMLLWAALWSVKLSLLFLYRRLLKGLPDQLRWWWGIFLFTIVTFIGCVVSNFTSCSSMHAWFTVGLCTTHHDALAQIASLYYSFAVDVISDLMIMLLPVKLIWSLRLPLVQKLSVGGIFCVGAGCIVIAIVRVVQIGTRAKNDSTPSSSWLAFWGMIEAGIAVIIGCLPAFAIVYRKARSSRRGGYGSGYTAMPSSYLNPQGIPLSNTSISASKSRLAYSRNSTTPSLAKPGAIEVTQSVRVAHENHDMI